MALTVYGGGDHCPQRDIVAKKYTNGQKMKFTCDSLKLTVTILKVKKYYVKMREALATA